MFEPRLYSGAVISVWNSEPATLALWEKPVPIEDLPLLVWLFEDGPEEAERVAAAGGYVALCYYARDDEMSYFHGRNGRAIYTFASRSVTRMTIAEFRNLKAASLNKLGAL